MSQSKSKKRGRPSKATTLQSSVSENGGNGLQAGKRKSGRPKDPPLTATHMLDVTTPGKISETVNLEVADNLNINKTYKLYIGGAFPRTESGRFIQLTDKRKKPLANYCRASRKDFRNAVVAARKAFTGWAQRSAFNRSQIIYRIAEMLEWRKDQFENELVALGVDRDKAQQEVRLSINRIVHYAGWADKYQQIFSSVNPVASSHFNFSMLEPMGVVSVFAPERSGLLGLISNIIPCITGGNTCVVLASSKFPTLAITLAEVLHSSDLPGGVVNMLTGLRSELISHFSNHMDVNAMIYCGNDKEEILEIKSNATLNIKRPIIRNIKDWTAGTAQSPYLILDTQETKTTWHPIGQ